MEVIVGISGASGAIYAVKLLKNLRDLDVKSQLIVTNTAKRIIEFETGLAENDIITLADHYYKINDMTAPISSGSFKTDGMVVAPCSMKTLAGIASGYSSNLLLRAADVTIKEKRRLVLVPRETPLSIIHLANMYKAALAGAIILPPVPSFYHKPKSVDEIVDHTIGKVLDIFDLRHNLYNRWSGKL